MIIENLTLDKIRSEIIKFKNDSDFQKLENFYYSKSYSEILGVSRREISHSNFITWILNNKEIHNLGFFPIKKLLDILLKHSNENQKQKYKELFNTFATDDYEINSLSITSEFAIKNVGRIDIFIELRIKIAEVQKTLFLVIENKVESKENNDQTNSYFRYFEQEKKDDIVILYVYLTPISASELMEIELTEPECNCKEFIQINYQSLVDNLLEPSINQNISPRTQNIISEYLLSLSQPSINDEFEGQKQKLIMALGNEERKLLSNFWEKNQKLIQAALYAISSDPEQDKDTRDSINIALDNLSQDKDRSTYSISFNDKLFIKGIRKSDIGLQTVKVLEVNNQINFETIEYLRQDKSCSFPLLKKREDFTETEIKYRKYKTNNAPELLFGEEEFYVARNWGKDNTEKFILKFSEKFRELKYENENN